MDTRGSGAISGADHEIVEATFTKWMLGDGPDMAGVVGGAVGAGSYSGRVLDYTPGPTQRIAAKYEFAGAEHSFAALVHVEQTGPDAEISGVVIDGWHKGDPVHGTYREIRCEHDGVTTDCWLGTLRVAGD